MKTYTVNSAFGYPASPDGKSYATLTEARAAIRAANGGKLFGKFDSDGNEGWNLGRNEDCDTAVIVASVEVAA
jgi:hypothetical protein